MRLLVATGNAGKLAELLPPLVALGFLPEGLASHPGLPPAVEDAPTFAGNAALKALHYARLTGLPTLADDSGLELVALAGEPGVRSARYAGPRADAAANNALLLRHMQGRGDRRARFRCALCLVEHGEVTLEVEGGCEGRLLEAPRGTQGFGYDPLFVLDSAAAEGLSFGELPPERKARLSHRAAALASLARALRARAQKVAP